VAPGEVEEGGGHPNGASPVKGAASTSVVVFWVMRHLRWSLSAVAGFYGGRGVIGMREQPPTEGRASVGRAHRGGRKMAAVASILAAPAALRWTGLDNRTGGLGRGHARSLARGKRGVSEKLDEGGHWWPFKVGWRQGEATGGSGMGWGCHTAEVGEGLVAALGGGSWSEGARRRWSRVRAASTHRRGSCPFRQGRVGADRWPPAIVGAAGSMGLNQIRI
jgi:hypothetical protein